MQRSRLDCEHRLGFVEHLHAAFDPVPIMEQVARIHASVWATLAAKGEAVGAHDRWIAATALAHGFDLATDDARSFRRIPGLNIVSDT